MATKEINCTHDLDSVILNYGEPCALFTAKIPKEAKILSRQTDKQKASLSAICLQPSLGKLIASDAKIITVMDIECCGIWPPEYENGKPFECFIDAKAITALAGKETDVAVWENKDNLHYLTGCEAVGVLTQYQCTGASFPNWQRVMPTEQKECSITIDASAIVPLRKFLSEHRGKTKLEKDFRSVVLHCTPEHQKLQIRIMDAFNEEITTKYFHIKAVPTHCLQQVFNLERFYLAIQADFTGEIAFCHGYSCAKATFGGVRRETLLIGDTTNRIEIYLNPAQTQS